MSKETFQVTFPDGTVTFLNPLLVAKKGLTNVNLDLLKHSHIYKWQLFKEMEEADNPHDLQVIAKKVEEVEFYQQELWGFAKNASMHKFWLVPQCECPADDNNEAYGSGHRIYAEHCPIHGEGWVK
jgi:hypothetical protein